MCVLLLAAGPAFPGMELASLQHFMVLRITRVEIEEGTCLRIDGRLDAESLTVLDQACNEVRSPLTPRPRRSALDR